MMRHLLLPAVLLLSACSSGNAAPARAESAATAHGTELPLPAVPDSLRQPRQRATFLLSHFWDSMDFADTSLTRNPAFMERNFANFVNLYPHADPGSLPAVTDKFLSRATADPESRLMLYDIITRYLSDSDSPVRSDSTYITFLSRWIELPGLDPYEMEEPRYRLAAALKNRTGATATDFKYLTREGKTSSLLATKASGLILLFYDPDCDHCMETIGALASDPTVNSLIARGELAVLAVYVEPDQDLWERTAPAMPQNWTVATDRSAILDSELYDIPEMPGLYLLDGDKRIILKQPRLSTLDDKLQDSGTVR